jgi:predicted  nucleic acid-binding Zn-ribbon protein
MIIRQKFEKQNNSIKQLLKKLRRHDTFVVAIAVVIALILCGGLIYLSTPIVAETATVKMAETTIETNEHTTEKLGEIKEYLTQLDRVVTDNQKSIDSIYETTNNFSNKETQENLKTVNNTITQKVTGLDKSMSDIHSKIGETNSRIADLEKLITSGGKDQSEKIATGFNQIANDLTLIQKNYADIQAGNKALSDELKKAIADGDENLDKNISSKYSELVTKLGDMDNKMDNNNKNTIDSFKDDISQLGAGVEAKIDDLKGDMNTGLDGVNSNVNEKMDSLSTDVGNKMDSLSTDVGNKVDSLSTDMGSRMDTLDQSVGDKISGMESRFTELTEKLDQVFQRLSNGKKSLASALLSKGVSINEDATFDEFSEAIRNIQLIEVGPFMPGDPNYVYHTHKDAEGNVVDSKYNQVQGGCFNREANHKHTSSCYRTNTYYIIRTEKDVVDHGFVRYDEEGHEVHDYECTHCNYRFQDTTRYHHETVRSQEAIKDRDGIDVQTKTERNLVCGKEEGFLGYEADCGYEIGQLEAVHIYFPPVKTEEGDPGNDIGEEIDIPARPSVMEADYSEGTSDEGDEEGPEDDQETPAEDPQQPAEDPQEPAPEAEDEE